MKLHHIDVHKQSFLGNELASGGASGDSPPCDPLRPSSVPTQREPDKSVCTVWYAMESTRKDQRPTDVPPHPDILRLRHFQWRKYDGALPNRDISDGRLLTPSSSPRAFGWYLRKVQTGLCCFCVAFLLRPQREAVGWLLTMEALLLQRSADVSDVGGVIGARSNIRYAWPVRPHEGCTGTK